MHLTVVQVHFIDQDNVNSIFFPSDLDPNQRAKFGRAQSILSRSFLLDKGASGEWEDCVAVNCLAVPASIISLQNLPSVLSMFAWTTSIHFFQMAA